MRSKFVTSLGWLTLVLCVVLGIAAAGEIMMARYLAGDPEAASNLATAMQSQSGQFVDVQNIPATLMRQGLINAITALIGIPTGVGLLKRRNWARKVTVAMIVLVTLGLVPTLVFGDLPMGLSRGVSLALFALVCLLHGDIVRRLVSPAVRGEFA